jgi:hypothetical protein
MTPGEMQILSLQISRILRISSLREEMMMKIPGVVLLKITTTNKPLIKIIEEQWPKV